MSSGATSVHGGYSNVPAHRDIGVRIFFRHFDAMDHRVENAWISWHFQPARPISSLAALALVSAWKVSYALERIVPPLRAARERSIMRLYLGAWLPTSDLRAQIAALRNDAQYRTVGAGIDVGYAPEETTREWAALRDVFKDPKTRLHMQMYLKLVSTTPLQQRRVLEVGCGQGDGAAFLSQALSPSKYFGVDLHPTQIELCHERFAYLQPRLNFQRASAQHLPFAEGAFDVVVNVESAHSYPDFDGFIREVFRVLKPGGSFCFADLKQPGGAESCATLFERSFGRAGFRVAQHEDITKNAWLSLDELRTQRGGRLWDEWESLRRLFGSRALEYHWYVLAKPAQGEVSGAPGQN